MLGGNPTSSLTPLQLANQRQQQARLSRGGFNQSEVVNSAIADYFPNNTFQISPSPPEQTLPPLIQGTNYTEDTENVAPGSKAAPNKTKSTTRQLDLQITALKKTAQEKEKLIGDLKKQVAKLTEEGDDREGRIAELLKSIRTKKGKQSRKAEQKQDVKTAIKDFVKNILFRTHKFAAPGDELNLATKKVWAGIKDKKRLEKGPNELTEKDFVEICDSVVSAALSDQRQCIQTRISATIKGK